MPKISEVECDVIKDFEQKVSIKKIAIKYNIKISAIYYILRKNNISVTSKIELEDTLMEQLSNEAKNGASLQQLSIKYNIDKTRLCRLLNSHNISDTIKQTIINFRQAGYSYTIIAQRLSITTSTVKDILKSFNIQKVLKNSGLTRDEIIATRTKLEKGNINK